ncbi:MAG: cbb3-type cytochrome c oxidase N-terminal domain-containing protein [Pirellula sp.]|jgi:cytochrome c oxidase cbb3-type subunit 3
MSSLTNKEPPVGHSYDGIQEYDNPLPGWWKWLFWVTIAASPLYLMYFHGGEEGRSVADQFQTALADNTRKQYKDIGDLAADEATMIKYLSDEKWLKVGKSIFVSNCTNCHGAEGGGNVGPNLCDENYKAVKSLTDIIKVVNEGLAGGAMPAWGKRLSHQNDLILVAVYVASLRGSKPAVAKGPDGSTIPPWPTSAEQTEQKM